MTMFKIIKNAKENEEDINILLHNGEIIRCEFSKAREDDIHSVEGIIQLYFYTPDTDDLHSETKWEELHLRESDISGVFTSCDLKPPERALFSKSGVFIPEE